jgi:hypothetical protein
MKINIAMILVCLIVSTNIKSQTLLGVSYDNIKNEAMKYNNIVYALLYKEEPLTLIICRTKAKTEYTKTYIFKNKKCISETYFYPEDEFTQKKTLFTVLYGEAQLESNVYFWIKDGLKITITTIFNKAVQKVICQINYAKLTNIMDVVNVNEKLQAPYTKMIKLKDK